VSTPKSCFLDGSPRLHYLEWNPGGADTIVLLHGNSANAWWWEETAALMPARFRLLALDQRGHGDSEWVRPPAYSPIDMAEDLARFIDQCRIERPIVVGHSMGGLVVLAFAERLANRARGVIVIDSALTSTHRRDRYLRRLKALPTVTYSDFDTARERFRLIPSEGDIASRTLHTIAEHSLCRTEDGRYTLKFDRESFFGSDGIDVLSTIRAVRIPILLVRGEKSRVMITEGAAHALESNPLARLSVIAGAHHHLPLERPREIAELIGQFAVGLHGPA
jgi:pimeloyl-ACP methyl ester carboxylesterase